MSMVRNELSTRKDMTTENCSELVRPKTSASSTLKGFDYQFLYGLDAFLERRINTDNLSVRFELLDDIEFIEDGRVTGLEQIKHHGDSTKKRSLTEFSEDIWKTLIIWAEFIARHQDYREVQFYFVTTQTVKENSIFFDLKNKSRTDFDLNSIVDRLDQHCQNELSKKNKNNNLCKYYKKFYELDRFQKMNIINRIYIYDNSKDLREIENSIKTRIQGVAYISDIDKVYEALIGWWYMKISEQIKSSSPVPIHSKELDNKLEDLRNTYSSKYLKIYDDIGKISNEFYQNMSRYNFCKQLKIIGVTEEQILYAAEAYYFAKNHLLRWTADFDISLDDQKKYQDHLYDEWKHWFADITRKAQETTDPSELARLGYEIYDHFVKNAEYDFSPSKQLGSEKKRFTRGTYHILAGGQSDPIQLGWHPHYTEELSKMGDE